MGVEQWMATTAEDLQYRTVTVPILGGEVELRVPTDISDSTLNKEIASQDIVRRKLLEFVDQLEHLGTSNREIFICPIQKLLVVTEDFLHTCHNVRKFISGFSSRSSSVAELEAARCDVRSFYFNHIDGEIDRIDNLRKEVFREIQGEILVSRREDLKHFRKKLAKSTGVVRTELQKFFAYLLVNDPRNLFRITSRKTQKEILTLQFKRDVEMTETLYTAVRKLDTYMRGAILPSDLLQSTAEKIETERSVECLFEQDYELFIHALIDEIVETLVPEVEGVLDLDGIWYDDYENIRAKIDKLADVCKSFRVFYAERSGLREKVGARKMIYKKMERRCRDQIFAILDVFNTHRYREIAESIRSMDQILVDLEGTLLQWERAISKRALARDEWRDAEPLPRRGETSVFYKE